MHVTHKDVPGELTSTSAEWLIFAPDSHPMGANRIAIHRPEIKLHGNGDDDCIAVWGFAPSDSLPIPELFKRSSWLFYPTPRPTPHLDSTL